MTESTVAPEGSQGKRPRLVLGRTFAAMAGISPSTLYRLELHDSDFPPPGWIGGQKCWPEQAVLEYLQLAAARTAPKAANGAPRSVGPKALDEPLDVGRCAEPGCRARVFRKHRLGRPPSFCEEHRRRGAA